MPAQGGCARSPPDRVRDMETWEKLVVGALALLVLFWFFPGIKPMMAKSKAARQDWPGLLIPIGLVVVFVLFLIASV